MRYLGVRLFITPLCLLALLSGKAPAQTGNCIAGGSLRIDAAFSRHGAGGTFDYSVQVSNVSNRPISFRITFRMSNAQVNPQLLRRSFTLPVNGNAIYILGNGTAISNSARIGGGVLLSC